MPKIIEGLRETILQTAKARLLSEGYQAFTIRALAKDCGVSPGTIYDYYSSKNAVLANAIGGDWRAMMEAVKAGSYESADDAIRALFEGVQGFVSRYRMPLSECTFGPRDAAKFEHGHRMLVSQLAAVIAVTLRPFRDEDDPGLARFIAETLLTSSRFGDCPYERIAPHIHKLLQ